MGLGGARAIASPYLSFLRWGRMGKPVRPFCFVLDVAVVAWYIVGVQTRGGEAVKAYLEGVAGGAAFCGVIALTMKNIEFATLSFIWCNIALVLISILINKQYRGGGVS